MINANKISSSRIWVLSLLLTLPIVVLYLSHFFSAVKKNDRIPTGFITVEMPYYVANALEYKEASDFHFCYALPFSADYHNKPIYFHPQIFVMGMFLKYTSIHPLFLFLLFGFIFAVLSIRISLLLLLQYQLIPAKILNIISILFIWGGGVLFVSGFGISIIKGMNFSGALKKCFFLDPFDGWWFLNLGRNFIFPTEAYYHFLFLATVYLVCTKKIFQAVLVTILLALSHPFTGIAMLLILICWMLIEKIFYNNESFKWNDFFVLIGGLSWFVYYNFFYLPSDGEHRILMQQWTLDWSAGFKNYFPAYLLVLIPASYRLRSLEKIKLFFSIPFNRFLIIWLIINLGLENHDLFIKPHQPLHFTRGYVWACLFLIGLPEIIATLKIIYEKKSVFIKSTLIIGLVAISLADNASWISLQSLKLMNGGGIVLNSNQKEVLTYLNNHYSKNELLISQDKTIGYLSTVYTPYRSLFTHAFNTPNAANKWNMVSRYLNYCDEDSSLMVVNQVLVVFKNRINCDWRKESQLIFSNHEYEIWRRRGQYFSY